MPSHMPLQRGALPEKLQMQKPPECHTLACSRHITNPSRYMYTLQPCMASELLQADVVPAAAQARLIQLLPATAVLIAGQYGVVLLDVTAADALC